MATQHKKIQEIIKFIENINKKKFSEKEIERLFHAMLSPNEIEVINQRIHVLELLYAGKSQREVTELLGIGIATATRGNRILKENTDLFQQIFSKNK